MTIQSNKLSVSDVEKIRESSLVFLNRRLNSVGMPTQAFAVKMAANLKDSLDIIQMQIVDNEAYTYKTLFSYIDNKIRRQPTPKLQNTAELIFESILESLGCAQEFLQYQAAIKNEGGIDRQL